MKFKKLFKSYKILVTAVITCIKGGMNHVKMKNTSGIKYCIIL